MKLPTFQPKTAEKVPEKTAAPPAPTADKPQDELSRIREELAKKEASLLDYTDHLKRLQAEFENYCKRTDKERIEYRQYASEKVIVKLLLIVDDFERALAQLKDVPPETKKGIDMIFKNLHKVLDEEKVEPINAIGQKLDPYKHEVMLQVESDKPEDTVLEELQRGYTMNGKVIRYARVKVSKGKANAANAKNTNS